MAELWLDPYFAFFLPPLLQKHLKNKISKEGYDIIQNKKAAL